MSASKTLDALRDLWKQEGYCVIWQQSPEQRIEQLEKIVADLERRLRLLELSTEE